MQFTDINDDIKMELVVDGVLNFFVVFVESILVKSDRSNSSNRIRQNGDETSSEANNNSANLSDNALRLLAFYRNSVCALPQGADFSSFFANEDRTNRNDIKSKSVELIAIRHQLLPIYEQLCELLVEVGTVPLLTSPAFLLKRRALITASGKSSGNTFSEAQFHFASMLFNLSPETLGRNASSDASSLTTLASSSNVRWFVYLLVLSANRLSSCSHMHHPTWAQSGVALGPSSQASFSCCALRHIAYTSLSTALDLLTISRAYLGAQHSAASALATASASSATLSHTSNAEAQTKLPSSSVFAEQFLSSLNGGSLSYTDMSLVDLFPGALTARKLNFFPLIHPDLLEHLYSETVWFKMIAVRLWSNLSPSDSVMHYSSVALLQQLHSISADSSVVEAVLCDEMTGGEHFRALVEEKIDPQQHHLLGYYGVTGSSKSNFFKVDSLFTARSRFQLLFQVTRDIRFISERLSLIVTGLASAAKIDPELESDDHGSDQYDPLSGSTLAASVASGLLQSSFSDGNAASASGNSLRATNQRLFLTNGLDPFSAEIVNCLDPTNFAELDRILRLTCPVSPVALCTTLKRHFDRPLFIMLDALAQRRTLSEHASSAADWLLRCLSPFDPFGGRNLPLPTSPLLAAYYLGANGTSSASSGDGNGPSSSYEGPNQDGFLFGGFGANTDIGRLLEPLLFILLHPNTSRLSVQNSNIQRYTRQGGKGDTSALGLTNTSFSHQIGDETDGQSYSIDSPAPSESTAVADHFEAADNVDESKIYAISSTNGNVIYHVRAKPHLKSSSPGQSPQQLMSSTQREMSSPSSYRSASPSVTLMTNLNSSGSPSGGIKSGGLVFNELVNASRLGDLPASLENGRRVTESIKLVVNPFDNLHNKSLPGHVEDVFTAVHDRRSNSLPLQPVGAAPPENVIHTVVKQVVSELINSVDTDDEEAEGGDENSNTSEVALQGDTKEEPTSVSEPMVTTKPRAQTISTSTPTSAGTRPTFPGMASSATKSSSPTNGANASASSSTRIHISHLHLHLLLYERQYDSARTIYALDTILNMIETWPNRMLYSMATSTFGESNSSLLPTSAGGFLDGTRSAYIQSLYMKHRNSILGRGFHYRPPQHTSDQQTSSRSSSFKLSGGHGNNSKRATSEETVRNSSPSSILHNISLLELIVQICLQYLRSYYPSCPSGVSSSERTSNSKSAKGSNGLEQLFSSLKNSQSTCIDLDSIYGNQRVRLMACEILRIVFQHLSSMIDQSSSGLLGSASPSSGRFFSGSSSSRSKGDSISGWAAHLRPFAQYIHDMLLRCEVQRIALQCLVTSVWHYQQNRHQPKSNLGKSNSEGNSSSQTKNSRAISSYLYPTLKSSHSPDPAANAFISEILEFNDYPAQIAAKTLDKASGAESGPSSSHLQVESENDAGFHDEFEKCLLRLLEQVMILECRVAGSAGAASAFGSSSSASASSSASSSNLDFSSPQFKFQRYQTELTELRFDPNVCLAGQPLLHGAIQLALQQNFRRHIHSTWLAFVESALPFAGRYLSRLVLCVLNQLCRNLDSSQEEIERCSVSQHGSSPTQPPFTAQHVITTLQSVTMLLSHCLLDRAQLEPLLPYLHEMFEDNNEEIFKTFGLAVHSSGRRGGNRRGRSGGRFDQEMGGMDMPVNGNGGSSGPIQMISSIFHNLMVVPGMGSSNGTSTTSSSSTTGSNSDSGVFSIGGDNNSGDSPAVLEARKSILGVLNRVIVSLFNVWTTMVVVGEDPTEVAYDSTLEDSTKNLGMCGHYYMHFPCFPRHSGHLSINSPALMSSLTSDRDYLAAMNTKSNRFKHSSCSSGWQTASNTGWYIMGTAAQVKKSIMILLSIVSASHGPCLMASLAQVWADLRDSGTVRRHTVNGVPTPSFNYFNGAIDLVIAPVSNSQRQLIQLLRSLSPIFSLETLIQTIRSTLKISSSSGGNNINPASNTNNTASSSSFYLTEVALLEIFLAYIRSYPGHMLLKSWRCINSLIKDAHSLNTTATIPLSMFVNQSTFPGTSFPSSSVTINIQPLVNFHLLAILHEFLFYAPLCEDRRAQKEMQDMANKLIESLISVAGSRLSHSRWTLRRNLEVLPMSSSGGSHSTVSPTEQSGTTAASSHLSTARSSPVVGNRNSTGYRTDVDTSETETEPAVAMKRGLFRNSGSVSFPDRSSQRTSTGSTTTYEPVSFETSSLHSHLLDAQQQEAFFGSNVVTTTSTFFSASASSDSLISGLFSLNFANSALGGSGSSSGGSQQIADLANSAQMLFDNFFCVKALYALSEVSLPKLAITSKRLH